MKIKTTEEDKINYKESYNKAWCLALDAMREGKIEESLVKEMFEPIPEHQVDAAKALIYELDHIEMKRIHPELKGDTKAKFENEFNTLKQIFNFFSWPGNQITYARKYALLWAAWGAYNLKDTCKMPQEELDKMDIIKDN